MTDGGLPCVAALRCSPRGCVVTVRSLTRRSRSPTRPSRSETRDAAVAQGVPAHGQQEQHRQLRRMAQRLSLFTDLRKYRPAEPPRWRTHGGELSLRGRYNDALIFGDARSAPIWRCQPPGASIDRARPADAGRPPGDGEPPRDHRTRRCRCHRRDQRHRAARLNGRRRELPAIDALEAHVIDPSHEQSATAVLGQDQRRRP